MENNPTVPVPAPMPPQGQIEKVKITPKEFFIWFGIILTLYSSVSALLTILFTVLNKALPDAQDYSYFFGGSGIGILSFPISMLIILFPIFSILTYVSNRSISLHPERAALGFRKFVIYFTIFLTAAMLATDLIVLVRYFLNGEITPRFIWKVVAVLIIAAITGWYYFIQLKKDGIKKSSADIIFAIVAWGIIIATFIYAFATLGSPKNERALQFDQTRVQNLQQIESSVLNYWQQHSKLPATLSDMDYIPKDPEAISGKLLEYNVKDGTSYEVCATFSTSSSKESETSYLYGPNSYGMDDQFVPKGTVGYPWKHDSGRNCFDRVIDPIKYKPYNQQ